MVVAFYAANQFRLDKLVPWLRHHVTQEPPQKMTVCPLPIPRAAGSTLEQEAWGRNLAKVSAPRVRRRDEDAALPITAEYPNLSAIRTQLHAIQPLSLYFLDSATGAAFTGLVFICFRPLITPYRRQSIR